MSKLKSTNESYNPLEIEPKCPHSAKASAFGSTKSAYGQTKSAGKQNVYKPSEIEQKWQAVWEREGIYEASDFAKSKKFYTLIEFPYPSAAGLHVGHVRSWSAMDAYSRKKRMEGYNVLYPIGWDAFGLPAENYALKMKIHPSIAVKENIANFKRQIKSLGISFDWSREIDTTDPKYYKWTQWIFLKFFEKGLAYQAKVSVNWCPFCKTNLADEEVLANGVHERCGNKTQKRLQKQWLLKITKYADRLLEDLRQVDYSEKIAVQQANWIGKKDGAVIKFKIKLASSAGRDLRIKNRDVEVFTTRPDTLFGATFLVLAPEHPIVNVILNSFQNLKIPLLLRDDIKSYIEQTKRKTEQERIAERKEKTGVFSGLYAVNPANQEEIPVWIADYALMNYGTGVLFGDAHDERDVAFAKKYGIPLKPTLKTGNAELDRRIQSLEKCFTGEGILVDSGEFTSLTSKEAKKKIVSWLSKRGDAQTKTTYHLRDWVFSRQHYWGEPIPIIHCEKCGAVAIPEKDLPVKLPYLEKYEPSGTGESPLANVKDWANTTCPNCGGSARRETDTMPNWAGSNWYYLAYLFADKLGNSKSEIRNPKLNNIFAESKNVIDYWMPVDLYQGGFEHTTLHLLYSRFVYKFLFDIGAVSQSEPYAKRCSHGIVLGSDGRKMSKSFGNVINPDVIVKKFGADTLRVYEMFMGPFDQAIAWSEEGVEGSFRFLKRIWRLSTAKISKDKTSLTLSSQLNKTIKKVGNDLENLKFNTAVASMMEFVNDWQKDKNGLNHEDLKKFLLVLAPFAPHMAEELFFRINTDFKADPRGSAINQWKSIHTQPWPKFDPKFLIENEATVAVQVNGKLRDTIKVQSAKCKVQSAIEQLAKESAKIKKYLDGKQIKKVIYVEGKIINFVTG